MKVTIICDRCGTEVEGWQTEEFTSNFYNVSEGSPWHRFSHSAYENVLCDPCMWDDPEYQAIYAHDGEMQQWMREKL